MTYEENWKHEKQQNFDLLEMCMKYFFQSTYNNIKTDVPKKYIYLTLQQDELLAVSTQIYEMRTQ